MKIIEELLPGCFLLQPNRFNDHRGKFIKTFHEDLFLDLGLAFDVREEFYSVSHRNVIRGMHFQMPPYAHDKLVFCANGVVLDVLLDLRVGGNYGGMASVKLSAENNHMIFIPKGIAHGFAALTEDALMLYKTSTVYVAEADFGVRWDSFGFEWDIDQPIISERDRLHKMFGEFQSPF